MASLELRVSREQAGRTVKSLLKKELGLSTALVNRLKRTESGLTANGIRVFTNAVLREGDLLAADLDAGEQPAALAPVPRDLNIIFEDEYLLVVDKPAPLACIPSSLSPGEPALAAGLLHYLGNGSALDRGTTGLVAAAKNAYIHDFLRRRMHTSGFQRTYWAVCRGWPEPAEGTVRLPIGRAPGSAIARRIDLLDGKPAETGYRTLRRGEGFSLVDLTPRTGRTHQIRVHMSAVGCPLAGDWLYGTEDPALIPRPALHAAGLELDHPVTGGRLALRAGMPEDMEALLQRFF